MRFLGEFDDNDYEKAAEEACEEEHAFLGTEGFVVLVVALFSGVVAKGVLNHTKIP